MVIGVSPCPVSPHPSRCFLENKSYVACLKLLYLDLGWENEQGYRSKFGFSNLKKVGFLYIDLVLDIGARTSTGQVSMLIYIE